MLGLGQLARTVRPVWRNHGVSFWRFQSTAAYTADDMFKSRLENLRSFITKEIETKDKLDEKIILEYYQQIEAYQRSIYDFNKLSPSKNQYIIESNEILRTVLRNEKTEFNESLLKEIFITQPLFPTLETIIKAYYENGAQVHIPSQLSFIPFRKLVWDGQYQQALDFVELTNGNPRYVAFRRRELMSIFKYFGGSIVGLIAGIHGFVSVCYPEIIAAGAGGTSFGIYGIYACIVTYLVNCGFLAGLSFSSKGMENGNLIFKQSTMPHDWYLKVDQMKMCSKILEADAEINGMDGFATRDVVSRIQKMGFDVNEPEQEVMLRQYWYSSGDGFLWVEPDIDPADVEWWKHLDDIGVKKVWDQDFSRIEQADASEEIEDPEINPSDDLIIPDESK